MIVETTYCPYCDCEIQAPFSKDNRLFASTIKCEECGESFVVSCAHITDEGKEPCTIVREVRVRQKKTDIMIQTTLTEVS